MSSLKGIAFEGGGMAGNGHVGAFRKLVEVTSAANFKIFAGTSAGSIMAAYASVRATPDWLEKKMMTTDFSSFRDSDWNPLDNAMRVVQEYGWYKGDVLEAWVAQCLEELTGKYDITFGEAHMRYGTTLIITATNVLYPRCKLAIMDWQSHADTPIYLAIRKSCSIPYAFRAVVSESSSNVFVDGGVLLNYPIVLLYKYLQPDQVVGIRLRSITDDDADYQIVTTPDTAVERPVRDHIEFVMSIATTIRELANSQTDVTHTCTVPVNIGSIDFAATKEQLAADIKNGYIAMTKFLKTA